MEPQSSNKSCRDNPHIDLNNTHQKMLDDINNLEINDAEDGSSKSNDDDSQEIFHQTDSEFFLDDNDIQLHKAVFDNNMEAVDLILKDNVSSEFINKKDKHGNTALHLACMLGRPLAMVKSLIEHGANPNSINLNRWTPIHEACSYGNKDIIKLLASKMTADIPKAIMQECSQKLSGTPNFKLEVQWEFLTWIPIISRILPNDDCVIIKHGDCIRIETSLPNISNLSWVRKEGSLIFVGKSMQSSVGPSRCNRWIFLNHRTRTFVFLDKLSFKENLESSVNNLMSRDILDMQLKPSKVQVIRSTSGWFWKLDKTEMIGSYKTRLYNLNNLNFILRKRREHLTNEELKRNKMAFNNLKSICSISGFFDKYKSEECSETSENRESLPPPPATYVTWEEYYLAKPGRFPILGRQHIYKETRKPIKVGIAVSEDFPLKKQELIDLLSILPLKGFQDLRNFIEMKIPDGFPLRLDLPVLPFITARVTFKDFKTIENPIELSQFVTPSDYKEEDMDTLKRLTRKRS